MLRPNVKLGVKRYGSLCYGLFYRILKTAEFNRSVDYQRVFGLNPSIILEEERVYAKLLFCLPSRINTISWVVIEKHISMTK